MDLEGTKPTLHERKSPLEMEADEFRSIGHKLVDQIADFLDSLPNRKVAPGETPAEVRYLLGSNPLPQIGIPAGDIVQEATDLLFNHSLFNGHPRFLAYITSSAAPIGAFADMLASAVNPNVGAWSISPIATELEAETVRWIAELLGYPTNCGGILGSGGNVANFIGFLVARKAKSNWDVRTAGMSDHNNGQLRVYCSAETHTWIEKATDQYGLGPDAIRWIPMTDQLKMDMEILEKTIEQDKANGDMPFLVVGTAGSTALGSIDDLPRIAEICREHNLWFHVDAAYGGFAAALPDAPPELLGLREADSVAIDPHKWLYTPLEAGCTLVRNQQAMADTFSYHPSYYKFDDTSEGLPLNYYEIGPQNSRGFRALKVWMALRQAGKNGYQRMIAEDIHLAKTLYQLVDEAPDLEAHTHSLSITTFRYVPLDLNLSNDEREAYLNRLNTELLTDLQDSGEAYISNAVLGDKYLLRSCIVNFRTSMKDIEALPEIITRIGRAVDKRLRS